MTTRDVGDGYPIGYEARDPDTGDLLDATVALTVIDPADGETTPAPVHPSTGVYRYTIPLTVAGNWRWRWDVTGAVLDVAHGEVTALDPTTPPLASTADIVDLLGRPLTAAEAARVPGLLASASTKLRAYCRRSFTNVEGDVIVARPVGALLRLPNRATAITSVQQIGTGGTADRTLSVGEYAFDGIDQIELYPWWPNDLPPSVPLTGSYADTYRVTYNHTGGTVPAFIVDMTVDMVQAALLAPTQTAGVVSERIGSYSYQLAQGGSGSPGASVKLTVDHKRDLREAGYRRSTSTVQLRAV